MSEYKKAIRSFKEGLPGGNAVKTAIKACEFMDEVVFCADCIHHDGLYCKYFCRGGLSDLDFCSRGERHG